VFEFCQLLFRGKRICSYPCLDDTFSFGESSFIEKKAAAVNTVKAMVTTKSLVLEDFIQESIKVSEYAPAINIVDKRRSRHVASQQIRG